MQPSEKEMPIHRWQPILLKGFAAGSKERVFWRISHLISNDKLTGATSEIKDIPTIAAEMIGSVGVKQAAIARQEIKFNCRNKP